MLSNICLFSICIIPSSFYCLICIFVSAMLSVTISLYLGPDTLSPLTTNTEMPGIYFFCVTLWINAACTCVYLHFPLLFKNHCIVLEDKSKKHWI